MASLSRKQLIRQRFRDSVFARDGYCCVMCGFRSSKAKAQEELDAHHITDRTLIENGGYVKENGISLCPSCHELAEKWHSSGHKEFHPGYHPEDLYKIIGSSEELAREKSRKL